MVLFGDCSYGIKHQRWMSMDTTVVQYTYFRLPNPYPRLDLYKAAGSQLISSSHNRDTISIEWLDDDNQKIGDTLLIGNQIAEFEALQDRYFNHRLSMILNGEVVVKPDELTLMETWQYRWVDDHPTSFRILNAKGSLTHMKTYSGTHASLIGHSYFVDQPDSMKLYAIDSLSWDENHSELRLIRSVLETTTMYSKTLHFASQRYRRQDSYGTTAVEYLMDTKPWALKLIHESFDEGPLVQCQLLTFQHERLKTWVSPNGSVSIHDYKLNDRGQPVEVRVLKDGKLDRVVEYSYAQP